jgi:excisionase family DNA binding protein
VHLPVTLGYTTREAAKLLGLPADRVRRYIRAGFLDPPKGPRGEYRFSFQDLVVLRTAKDLSASRIPARRIRRALERLADELPGGRHLAALRITVRGGQVVVQDGGESWDPESGQRVLDFEVAELAELAAPLAHRAAERARELEGLEAEDWYGLGWELETTVADRAEEAYRRALELDPQHADAHLNLGRLMHAFDRLDEAERHFREALELRPMDATAAFDLGVVLQDREDPQGAIAAYRRAIAADPSFADAYFNLASLFEAAGERAEAFHYLKSYRDLLRPRAPRRWSR